MESSNLASLRTSDEVKLYLWESSPYMRELKMYFYNYLPTILRESRVPMVMPKFLKRALANPGTTALSAVKACMACSRPSISAFVRSSTSMLLYLKSENSNVLYTGEDESIKSRTL